MSVRYPKHAETVAWARAQLGKSEIPSGSNAGAFVRFCQSASWLGGTGWPWCRAFSLRAHLEGGFTLPDGSAGAWDALERARGRGDALPPAEYRKAVPGDEVIWSFGSGHCSILESFSRRAGVVYVQTIDGNVRDRVTRCERPLGQVRGFIRWRETPVAVKPVRPPRAQVVGGASGRRKLVTRKGRVVSLPQGRSTPVAGNGLGGAYRWLRRIGSDRHTAA